MGFISKINKLISAHYQVTGSITQKYFVYMPPDDALIGGLEPGILHSKSMKDAIDEILSNFDWQDEYSSLDEAKKEIENCIEEWSQQELDAFEKKHKKLKFW